MMVRRSFLYSIGALSLSLRIAVSSLRSLDAETFRFKSINYRIGLKTFFEKNCLRDRIYGYETPVTLTILSEFADHQGPSNYFKDRFKWQDLSKLEMGLGELKGAGLLLSLSTEAGSSYSSSTFTFKNYEAAKTGYELIADTINGASVPSNLNFSIKIFEGLSATGRKPKFEFEIA
jgi:hypothetical protein